MIEDPESALWETPGLNLKLKGYLGRKHGDVKGVISEINEQVLELGEILNKTSDEFGRDVKASLLYPLLTATERANEAFSFMLLKSSWESRLENIKDLNQELERLRKMAAQVHTRRTCSQICSSTKMPRTYKVMSEYARSLSTAIKYCWSCTETMHMQHLLGFTLETPNDQDLHISFYCKGIHGFETRALRHVFVSSKVAVVKKGAETVPALNIFRRALDADLPIPQQLRLVLQIAQAMLKLHATPWWKQYWSLSDLSYVEESDLVDISDCLRTLHVGTCLDFPPECDEDTQI
ncbi:hypothetical protein PG994_008313 [Apiospora phragmitis]|uniref:Uncharacterized protein n=1 Tax=Apiospora phragmitis TaxID=2905665 RepID=A0ABR1USS5_9PEZI